MRNFYCSPAHCLPVSHHSSLCLLLTCTSLVVAESQHQNQACTGSAEVWVDQTGHRGCSLRLQPHSAMNDSMQQDQGCAAVLAAGVAPAGLPTCTCPSCKTTPQWLSAGCAAQVLRLGPGINGLSLSPTQALLATTHANHHGIYLWANQPIFGHGATDLVPSEVPVDAELPLLAAGATPAPLGLASPLLCPGAPVPCQPCSVMPPPQLSMLLGLWRV